MDYYVMRVCDGGRRVEKHVRLAGRTRGVLSIRQETDPKRHRATLVARLACANSVRSIPPLYDVALIGTSGDSLMLIGVERISAGPLQREYAVGQTWIVEPAIVQDTIDAETKWQAAAREAAELRERLQCLTQTEHSANAPRPPPEA